MAVTGNMLVMDEDFYKSDRLFIRQIRLLARSVIVPQHSHTFDHATMLASGEIDVWLDGEFVRRMRAPGVIPIAAGTRHLFVAVVPSVLYCIHALEDGQVEHSPHEFSDYAPGELADLLGKVMAKLGDRV